MGVAKGQLFFLGVVMVGGSLNEWVGLSIDVHLRSFMAQVGLRVGIEGAGRPDPGADSPHISTFKYQTPRV